MNLRVAIWKNLFLSLKFCSFLLSFEINPFTFSSFLFSQTPWQKCFAKSIFTLFSPLFNFNHLKHNQNVIPKSALNNLSNTNFLSQCLNQLIILSEFVITPSSVNRLFANNKISMFHIDLDTYWAWSSRPTVKHTFFSILIRFRFYNYFRIAKTREEIFSFTRKLTNSQLFRNAFHRKWWQMKKQFSHWILYIENNGSNGGRQRTVEVD